MTPPDPHSLCLGAVCTSYKHLTKRRYSLGQQVVFILYYKCCHNFHKLLITMSLVYLQDRCCLPHYPTTHLLLHVVPISVTTSPPGYKAHSLHWSAPIQCHVLL